MSAPESGIESLNGILGEIETRSREPNAGLTPDQVQRCIRHVLLAMSYQAETYPDDEYVRGAIDIVRGAGMFVRLRSEEFGQLFTDLGDQLWSGNTLDAVCEVIASRQCQSHGIPENAQLYRGLGLYAYERDWRSWKQRREGGEQIERFSHPSFEPITADTKIGEGAFLRPTAITDWLLDTP